MVLLIIQFSPMLGSLFILEIIYCQQYLFIQYDTKGGCGPNSQITVISSLANF